MYKEITIDNLLYKICVCINNIDSIPKYKVFKRNKLKKELNDMKNIYFSYDIYDVSNTIIHIMQSECSHFKMLNNGMIHREINNTYLQVSTLDASVVIIYYPKSNRIHITDKNISYDMYKNTKCAKSIQEIWDNTYDIIKDIYYDLIVRYANVLKGIW